MATVCRAATYYIDARGGEDSNSGTSENAPWKTIAKINRWLFHPGDNILFKRGATWREKLIPPSSGIAGKFITFGDYGTGHKPVVKGSDLITMWSKVDGAPELRMTIMHIKPCVVWEDNKALKICHSMSAVKDSPGSFYWNAGKLYIRATSGCPGTNEKTYEAAQRTDSCRIENKNYLVIKNLDFFQSGNKGGVGLRIVNDSNHIIISHCDFSQATDQHLAIWGDLPSNGHYTISGCTFERSGLRHNPGSGSAIDVFSTGSNDITVTGEYNTFTHVGENRAAPYLDHGIYFKSGRLLWRYNCHNDGGIFSGACVKISGTAKNGCKIYYNIFFAGRGSQPWGILSEAGSGHKIYNNVFYNVDIGIWQSGRNVPDAAGGYGIIIKNNVFHTAKKFFIRAAVATGLVSDYNVYFNGPANPFQWGKNYYSFAKWKEKSGQDDHSVVADPEFVQPVSGNFRLRDGSPCIKSGINVGLTRDFNKMTVSSRRVDIGAFGY